MSFTISSNVSTMRCASGEPIVFSYQPASSAGVAESLSGRAFVWALYDDNRNEIAYNDATIVTGVDGQSALWTLDGTFSGANPGATLNWEIAERLDNGRDTIATGKLIISVGAPRINDFNAAPVSRYISHITRLNDPSTIDAPVYRVVIAAYGQITGTSGSFDFSTADNSALLVLI